MRRVIGGVTEAAISKRKRDSGMDTGNIWSRIFGEWRDRVGEAIRVCVQEDAIVLGEVGFRSAVEICGGFGGVDRGSGARG